MVPPSMVMMAPEMYERPVGREERRELRDLLRLTGPLHRAAADDVAGTARPSPFRR